MMKKIITLILSLVLALSFGDTASAKKAKTQRLSSVTYSRSYLSGKGTKGAKITAKHGKKKLGSARVNKKGKFKFKLKSAKNKWKVTVTATKKGYKTKKKTITLHIAKKKVKKAVTRKNSVKKTTAKKTPAKKTTPMPIVTPDVYLNGRTLVTKQGTITLESTMFRETDPDTNETNGTVLFYYTNTTSKLQDISDLLSDCFSATQQFSTTTKSLGLGFVSSDSKYYDMAQAVDNDEQVNPGKTIYSAYTRELDSPTLPVKITVQDPDSYKALGSFMFY